MKKIWGILEVFIILYVICVTLLILCQNKYGYTELFGYTFKNIRESDVGQIKNTKSGDLIVIKNSRVVQPNDTIYYYDVSSGSYIIFSAVIVKVNQDNYIVHTDNKDVEINSSRIIGKETRVFPFFGNFLEKIESQAGFLLFVLIPIMIVFIYQVYEFFFAVHKQVEAKDSIHNSLSVKKCVDYNLDKSSNITDSLIIEDKTSDLEVIEEDKSSNSELENCGVHDDKSSDLVKEDILVESERAENGVSTVKDELEEERFKFVVEDKSDDELEIL